MYIDILCVQYFNINIQLSVKQSDNYKVEHHIFPRMKRYPLSSPSLPKALIQTRDIPKDLLPDERRRGNPSLQIKVWQFVHL